MVIFNYFVRTSRIVDVVLPWMPRTIDSFCVLWLGPAANVMSAPPSIYYPNFKTRLATSNSPNMCNFFLNSLTRFARTTTLFITLIIAGFDHFCFIMALQPLGLCHKALCCAI